MGFRGDGAAIHDNESGEINAITEKGTPVDADLILIEDSAASNAKKKLQVGNLPGFDGDLLTTKGDLLVHNGSAYQRLSVGSDDQVLTADSAQSNGVKWAAGGAGSGDTVKGWVKHLRERLSSETGHTDDDFYTSDSSADYTTQTVSGTATWTLDSDFELVSVKFDDQSVGDVSAYLKAITSASAPMTVETRMRFIQSGDDFYMGGVVFTDGTATSSNAVGLLIVNSDTSYLSQTLSHRSGTLTDFSTAEASLVTNAYYGVPVTLYLRVTWVSSNTFAVSYSIDGVTWTDNGAADQSTTMTPTHFGFAVSTYSGTVETLASFDYLRVYDSDLSV